MEYESRTLPKQGHTDTTLLLRYILVLCSTTSAGTATGCHVRLTSRGPYIVSMLDHLLYFLRLLPDVLCYTLGIVLLLRLPSARSVNVTNSSHSLSPPGGHKTLSRPSSSYETLKRGMLPFSGTLVKISSLSAQGDPNPSAQDTTDRPALDGSPYQPPDTSQPVAPPVIFERPTPIHTPNQGNSSPRPPTNSPRAVHFNEAQHQHLQAPVTTPQFSPPPRPMVSFTGPSRSSRG